MPKTSIRHFQEDIGRAESILMLADGLPTATDNEQLLRDDVLRSVWMFAVGAMDAFFCDLYTDLVASVIISKERQPAITLPRFLKATDIPLGAVFSDHQHRQNWRWRMMSRQIMERDNMLSIETIRDHFNPFLRDGHKLFTDVIDSWIMRAGASRRQFGISRANFQAEMQAAANAPNAAQRRRVEQGLRNRAVGSLKKRFTKIIQRRHDCIHNCDRPKFALQRIQSAGSVRHVVRDVRFLVENCNQYISQEFRAFLMELGCDVATISQTGY